MHESFNVWVKKIIPYRFGYWGGVQYVEHYNLIQEGKNVSAYYQKKNVRPIFVLRHYLYSLSIQNLVQHIFLFISTALTFSVVELQRQLFLTLMSCRELGQQD